jgi:AraC-like DNA-binding protein
MPADNTAHLRAAAQRRTEQTRRRAMAALRRMDNAGAPITLDGLAREAGVSRSWLYTQPDLRAEIQRRRRCHQPTTPPALPPERQRATEASLLRRLQAATDRIHRLEHDNQQLREALARALGEHRTAAILGRDTPNREPAKLVGPC